MQEAERLGLLKNKKAKTPQREEQRNKERKEAEVYLDRKLIAAEKKKPFMVIIMIICKFIRNLKQQDTKEEL